jgi:hypothetical protein
MDRMKGNRQSIQDPEQLLFMTKMIVGACWSDEMDGKETEAVASWDLQNWSGVPVYLTDISKEDITRF